MTRRPSSRALAFADVTDETLDETVSDFVAARVKAARKVRGWKPIDVAIRCDGISENSIENIESGRRQNGRRTRTVSVDELFELARALDVRPYELLPMEGDSRYFAVTDAHDLDDLRSRRWRAVVEVVDLHEVARGNGSRPRPGRGRGRASASPAARAGRGRGLSRGPHRGPLAPRGPPRHRPPLAGPLRGPGRPGAQQELRSQDRGRAVPRPD